MTDPSPTPRLPLPFGRLIDRERTIPFSFEGKAHHGHPGDTLAAALLSRGVRTLSRSFKYHRPRGVQALSDFGNPALVQVGNEPNVPADRLLLRDGLPPITAQNRRGTVGRDRNAWVGLFSRFLPVGFYYRSFFDWRRFEPRFRRLAGLGVLDRRAHHASTDKQYLFADIAVIGGGRAGMAAARAAAETGAEVVLIETSPTLGGFSPAKPENASNADFPSNVKILTGALAQGLFADQWLSIETERRYYKLRARAVVIATGVIEQPIVFRNNDLPGVMTASAASRLIWLYGVQPGRRAVVATVNDHGLEAARDLAAAGVTIAAIADARPESARNDHHQALEEKGIPIDFSTLPHEAMAQPGSFFFGAPVDAVRLAQIDDSGEAIIGETVACDLVVMAGGYTPAAALACHSGAKLVYDRGLNALVLKDLPAGVIAAGSISHIHDPAVVIADGARSGILAARHAGFDADDPGPAAIAESGFNHPFPIIHNPRGKAFVDFDEDLTLGDIENAVADGFSHPELLKRWSTAGMGPSQGRHSAVNVERIAARARGGDPEMFGPTTLRPPLAGERFDRLAGRAFHPWRDSPMQRRHETLGAEMMLAGLWRRPAVYPANGNRQAAIAAEVEAVRTSVGLIDVSPLGKIEIRGPDAAVFLDRIYLTPHAKQPVGRSRYAILLDDGGSIVDDGVACRFGEEQFYVTATTGQADATYRLLTWFNAQWQMAVDITNSTGAFAAVNIAGPLARVVLSPLVEGIDMSTDGFPYLAVRSGSVGGIPARLLRVGFVGELGYEIHVPAIQGEALWDLLTEAGKPQGLKPFGVEAQRLLRLEKGHVIIGQDTDGLTTPHEANMAWAVRKTKQDYRGKAAVDFRQKRSAERILTGFRLTQGQVPPPENCLVIDGDEIAGRVTSAAVSAACDGVIGLAFVPPGANAPGTPLSIRMPNGDRIAAVAAETPFYDPSNERQAL
ncbi:MAG: FAD-dependent oxidoreductase [Hyphomicrobiales bacterium]|nr:FAD-dependent oxidoreductase [Hyphomicrobiales bacterium]